MHIGGLTIVEGPPPATSELLEQIRMRLHLVPRYRHKLASTPIDSGRPVWVDDPSFNLDYHIRHTALPPPGGWEQLCALTARIFSQQLDRSKPMWEMWLIEGLEDDRFALITKTHHSLVDGIAGVDLATVLFDLSPEPPPIRSSGRAWQPRPEPRTAELIAAGLRGAVRAGLELAVGTGALRTFLISRRRRTAGCELRALVPVSVRAENDRGEIGNRIVVIRGPLPVYIADPLQRLRFITQTMNGLKESKQALGAEVIAGAQNFAPPTILAQASRLNFSTRLFNLIVTNVPGPQFPLYVLGREMLEVFPVAFLPENHSLAIAIMSYNGQMNFGLLGDFDALPDIEEIGEDISEELANLVSLARE